MVPNFRRWFKSSCKRPQLSTVCVAAAAAPKCKRLNRDENSSLSSLFAICLCGLWKRSKSNRTRPIWIEYIFMVSVWLSISNIDTLFHPLFLFNIFTTRPSGHPLWTLLSHVTLPLTLFYRFHSASCLVDIWKSAYEAPEQQCWTQLERKKTVKNFKCKRLAENVYGSLAILF